MKILVTGGAGYIGSHAVRKLLQKNHEVVVIDNLSNGHLESLPKNIKFIKADIGDSNALEKVFRPRTLKLEARKEDKFLAIIIEDNGIGIAKENLPKIYDPFFTTKEVGEGRGLGLSLSYGIVREHGGDIIAESDLGKGCRLKLLLPMQRSAAAKPAPAPSSNLQRELHKLRLDQKPQILIVEDETAIVTLMQQILELKNYEITTAANGQRGLTLIENHDFDLIICDFRMPKISGPQLFEKVIQAKPYLSNRFLFITGFTSESGDEKFLESHHLPHLLEPFTQETLIQAVESGLKTPIEEKR